eukprot:TRINITY_DN358_c0_g1_i1.p1 TRINITY_DN358_c0_g1~~TRINITY_DN358_c0_g1_i1.p1  ORF type:complete len:132 (-),score=40.95 TRINITY_DN358_c0_g1_i1:30-425(-)
MVHSDGDGEEKGELMVERKITGKMFDEVWTTTLKTTAGAFGGKPIIPAAISNMEVKLESNRKTYLNAKYVNPAKNRDIHVNVDTIPDTKILHFVITNGARKHDLSIKYNDVYKFWEQGTFFEIDGTSLGEQ